jgi:hypothetical protein
VNTEVTNVPEQSSGNGGADRSFGQKVKRTVESKVLVPLAATVVSAGVGYLARKLPLIIEEKLLPKLKEKGAPELAKKVEAAASVLPGTTSGGDGGTEERSEQTEERPNRAGARSSSGSSNDEREAERRKREERRQERKRAPSSA